MPQLDVSFLLLDPMFSDSFTCTRRAESVDGNGRPVITPTITPNLRGVITQEDPSDLDRADDADRVPRVITLITKVQIQGSSLGYKPDLITWDGTDYLVTSVKPYSRYGAGFYEVKAESMTATDVPQ